LKKISFFIITVTITVLRVVKQTTLKKPIHVETVKSKIAAFLENAYVVEVDQYRQINEIDDFQLIVCFAVSLYLQLINKKNANKNSSKWNMKNFFFLKSVSFSIFVTKIVI
jgi:hypothetical protein